MSLFKETMKTIFRIQLLYLIKVMQKAQKTFNYIDVCGNEIIFDS